MPGDGGGFTRPSISVSDVVLSDSNNKNKCCHITTTIPKQSRLAIRRGQHILYYFTIYLGIKVQHYPTQPQDQQDQCGQSLAMGVAVVVTSSLFS